MGPRFRFPVLMVLLAAALLVTWFGFLRLRPAETEADRGLPTFGPMPSFTLIDHEGQQVQSGDLQGKTLLIGFIYTTCPDICPTVTLRMRDAQEQLAQAGLLGSETLLLSVTVDPERDTPPVLAEYAAGYRVDSSTWRFLTGDLAEVRQTVVDGFHLAMERTVTAHAHEGHGTDSYVVDHSGRVVLVDRTGQIRAYYQGEELDPAQIIADIRSIR